MAAIETVARMPAGAAVTEMERLLADQIRLFCAKCDEVIERGYRGLIRGAPNKSLMADHRRDLQWALRSARLYWRLASSEDFADRPLAELLAVKLRQIEEHWKYLYEPPSPAEGDRLRQMIHQAFPDESRA